MFTYLPIRKTPDNGFALFQVYQIYSNFIGSFNNRLYLLQSVSSVSAIDLKLFIFMFPTIFLTFRVRFAATPHIPPLPVQMYKIVRIQAKIIYKSKFYPRYSQIISLLVCKFFSFLPLEFLGDNKTNYNICYDFCRNKLPEIYSYTKTAWFQVVKSTFAYT